MICSFVQNIHVLFDSVSGVKTFVSSQTCASKLVHILPLCNGFVNNHGSAFEQVAFIETLLRLSHYDFLQVAFIEILRRLHLLNFLPRLSHCHFLLPSRMDREVWFD